MLVSHSRLVCHACNRTLPRAASRCPWCKASPIRTGSRQPWRVHGSCACLGGSLAHGGDGR